MAQMGAASGWRSLALQDAGSWPTFGILTWDIRTINSASFIPLSVARIERQVFEMRVSMWPLGPAAESATVEALAAGSAHSMTSSSMACGVAPTAQRAIALSVLNRLAPGPEGVAACGMAAGMARGGGACGGDTSCIMRAGKGEEGMTPETTQSVDRALNDLDTRKTAIYGILLCRWLIDDLSEVDRALNDLDTRTTTLERGCCPRCTCAPVRLGGLWTRRTGWLAQSRRRGPRSKGVGR